MSTATEVIVVSAQHDVGLQGRGARRRPGRQIPNHAVPRSRLSIHFDVERQLDSGDLEPGDVRVPGVERRLGLFERLVWHVLEHRVGYLPTDARGHDSRARHRRIEGHGNDLARIGRSRTGNHEQGFRASLARGKRLVAKPRMARQHVAGLLIHIFGVVAQHQDDLVGHVDGREAVVAEPVGLGHRETVAHEDHRPPHLGDIGERQRSHGLGLLPTTRVVARGGRGWHGEHREAGPAVADARRELEGDPEVVTSW